MVTVTVIRIVPPPIIGVTGVVPEHAFAAFEESLDWLEATGTVVDRIDPSREPEALIQHTEVRERLETDGPSCLPLVLVNGTIVSAGHALTRTALAHEVARHAMSSAQPAA